MTAYNQTKRGFLGRAMEVFGAAVSVSAAVENHRKPRQRDLAVLGIDAKAFERL